MRRTDEEVLRVLKKLALAAIAAGALAAVRKRSGGKVEADLWHEATRGPGAVSTPTDR
ncbi:DLW-39 family protein [Blastococcus deserti]|uniref:DLW-39 family protein n=1 Tax=Blastococcus deserti TaxID=2259033 RepID=A0ABW4XB65_9ACTN